jgi:hypothetical protein
MVQLIKAISMHQKHRYSCAAQHFTLALLLSGAVGVLSVPVYAEPASQAEAPIRMAQNVRSDEYLPPWQRSNGGAAPAQDNAPQQISPPPRNYNPPPAPPPQQQPSANVYDSTGAPPSRGEYAPPPRDGRGAPPPYEENTYSSSEIVNAGHRFFGGVSKGLAQVVEYTFQKQGRPNGYILGEEGGGAIVAGLRYGEGTLYTKNAGVHRIYWQGPSLGYDIGGDGSKTLTLVYNLEHLGQMYGRFAGVDGSAYLVGGVGVTFLTYDDVVLAPIRSGIGLRLGANIGYLKYTRSPTWNPF